VAGGVIAAGAIGAGIVLPQIVRGEVIRGIERRTGMRCEVDQAVLGASDVALRGVVLRNHEGSVEVRLDEVLLDAGLPALVGHGGGAVRSITLRGGEIRVDGAGEGFAAVLQRLWGPPDGPRETGERSSDAEGGVADERGGLPARALSFQWLRTRIRDEHGEFAVVGALDARISQGGIEVVARDLMIGPGTAEAIAIQELRAEADMSTGKLRRLEGRGIRVEVADVEGEARPGPVGRARALVRRVLGAREEDGEDPAGQAGPLGWLAPEFSGRIHDARVRRWTAEGARDVLTGLAVELDRVGPDVVRTRGRGSPDGGGRLGWNLRIAPLALRAEGSIDLADVAVAALEPVLPEALPLHRPEQARVTGELQIQGRGDELQAAGRIAVRDLGFASPQIASQPVSGITVALEGEARFQPAERRLEIARLGVQLGPAEAVLAGAIEWAPDHYLFDLQAEMAPTRCSDAIAAIPRDLLQEVMGFQMSGTIAARVAARVDSRDLDATRLTIRIDDRCRFDMVPPIADLGRFEGPFLHRVQEPDGSIFEMQTGPGTEAWTPIPEISPFLVHAVLGHEDAGFFSHAGFSVGAIREALVRNLRAGRYVMGASTISMQLVKNVFLMREKTLARKVQEVLLTWWIERALGKERILELYLNVIEYGPGVYGIRNAARHYFGVEPGDLTPAQAAYLAMILPNPKAYHAHWESRSLPPSWANRIARFVRLLGERGRYDAGAVEDALREIPQLSFHRPGEPVPAPRRVEGGTAALPISGHRGEPIEAEWNEAPDGEVPHEYE
jgi:monofunctional biosynthetic peptidoglycan transglycosylase